MKELDTYLDLCTQVYELSKPMAAKDAYAFYKRYATEAGGTIFEPMCGTGRFLLPLAKDGFAIDGSDASKHMLAVLKGKAEGMKLKPNVWQSAASEIPDDKSYSLIFIPSGSFGLITDTGEVCMTLKSFYDHLDDRGTLVFEAETRHAVPELGLWRGSSWVRADGKMILLSSCASMENDIYSIITKYELVDKNCVVHTEVEVYKIKIYESSELLKLLKNIGFNAVKTVKTFEHGTNPDDSDECIVYECSK